MTEFRLQKFAEQQLIFFQIFKKVFLYDVVIFQLILL